MSYVGSTEASTVANPPIRISFGGISQSQINESTSVVEGYSMWMYNSTHLSTELMDSNFFTDAKRLGMVNGDGMIAICRNTGADAESSTNHVMAIGVITGVSTSGANLSTGGTITSTFA